MRSSARSPTHSALRSKKRRAASSTCSRSSSATRRWPACSARVTPPSTTRCSATAAVGHFTLAATHAVPATPTSSCPPGRLVSQPSAAPALTFPTVSTRPTRSRFGVTTEPRLGGACARHGTRSPSEGSKPSSAVASRASRSRSSAPCECSTRDSSTTSRSPPPRSARTTWTSSSTAFEELYAKIYAAGASSPELGYAITSVAVVASAPVEKPVLPSRSQGTRWPSRRPPATSGGRKLRQRSGPRCSSRTTFEPASRWSGRRSSSRHRRRLPCLPAASPSSTATASSTSTTRGRDE